MKPLTNIAQIKNRIAKVAAKAPAKPLKNHGFARVECSLPRVFKKLCDLAPAHCSVVTSREPINRFGKLGFVGHNYISPELSAVTQANSFDFAQLETSLACIESFGL